MPRRVVAPGVPNVKVTVSPATESEPKSEEKSEDEPLTEEQRIADEAIEESTAGAMSQAVAWIYRVTGGQKAYVGSVEPDLVSHQFLLNSCGDGEYFVIYRRPKKTGGTEQSRTRKFLIDAGVGRRVPSWVAPAATPAAPAANGAAPPRSMDEVMASGVMTLIKGMQDTSTTNAQLTQAAIERLREPKAEGMTAEKIVAILTPIVSAVAGVAVAIVQRPLAPMPDPMATATALAALTKQKDPAELLAALAPILRPPPGPPADVTQLGGMIAALKGLVDLKESLGGNGNVGVDTGNPILDTVRDVARAIPEVASAAKVAMQQRQTNAPPGPAEAQQQPPTTTSDRRALSPGPGEPMGPPRASGPAASIPGTQDGPAANGSAQTEEAMLRAFLAPISAEVIQLARANRDPVRIAQAFLDLHEKYLEQIAWWVEQPNCVQNFFRDFPEWQATPELKRWLEEFIQTIDRETHEAPQT